VQVAQARREKENVPLVALQEQRSRRARKQAISNGGGPRSRVYSSDCSIARPDPNFSGWDVARRKSGDSAYRSDPVGRFRGANGVSGL
jgi:hypothetical protein